MEKLGGVLGDWLGEQFGWDSDDREIAAFSLTVLISLLFTFAVLLLFAVPAGVLPEALVIAGAAGSLRVFAGGAHLSTGWRCGIVSAAVATGAAWTAHRFGPPLASRLGDAGPWVTVLFALIVAMAMARLAPVDVPEKPITSESHRRRLKRAAVVASLLWGLIGALLLAAELPVLDVKTRSAFWLAAIIGICWETFSVTPPGDRFVHGLDEQITQVSCNNERR